MTIPSHLHGNPPLVAAVLIVYHLLGPAGYRTPHFGNVDGIGETTTTTRAADRRSPLNHAVITTQRADNVIHPLPYILPLETQYPVLYIPYYKTHIIRSLCHSPISLGRGRAIKSRKRTRTTAGTSKHNLWTLW